LRRGRLPTSSNPKPSAGRLRWTFEGGTNCLNEGASVAIVINKKALTVSGITANNKPFDGNITATLNLGTAALVGVVTPGCRHAQQARRDISDVNGFTLALLQCTHGSP